MSELLTLLEKAHYECCKRNNISSHVLLETYAGSRFTPQAIAAAISTIGDFHAPVHKVLALFLDSNKIDAVSSAIKHGVRIPGWGSSFIKNRPDPIFNELSYYLNDNYPEELRILKKITAILHGSDKFIYPNDAAFTALVGKIYNYSPSTIHFLLVSCRLRGWLETINLYETEGEYFFIQGPEVEEESEVYRSGEGGEAKGSLTLFKEG